MFPLIYLAGRKSSKIAAALITSITLIDIGLLSTTIPTVLNAAGHKYLESYTWIPILKSQFSLFVDGISLSLAIITLVLILTATIFSVRFMNKRKRMPKYYAFLTLLSVGLIGVFITSNLLVFYFFWELMLVPAYFLIGEWGSENSYRAAFKFFIFTHAGAVFVLLGIGGIFMATGSLDIFNVQTALMSVNSGIVKWILISVTAGFCVKMAIVPVHLWLPDTYSAAPAPIAAILSGIMTGAGAYAILRVSLETIFPSLMATGFASEFLHSLVIFGVVSALFGSLIALAETDIRKVIAYSSISQMGYVLFGLSLFTIQNALTGTVLHLLTHAVSKALLFLSAGVLIKQFKTYDIHEMGGLAGKTPFTSTSSIIAALSIAGVPPFACFISEFLIFIGAFQDISFDNFYILPTTLMLIAAVLSSAYILRYIANVFFGQPKTDQSPVVPISMKIGMGILAVFVVVLGIWPTFFTNLITTASFI